MNVVKKMKRAIFFINKKQECKKSYVPSRMYLLIIDNILIRQQIKITNVSTLIGLSSVYVKNNK